MFLVLSLSLANDIKHFCWNWSMASFNCIRCSGDRSSMLTSTTSWISGFLNQLDLSHQACQKVCWRKISTSHQAHSKPDEAGLTHVPDPKRASQFSWNWQRTKSSYIKPRTCRVVPDSSVFTAKKPIKMTYSYNKLSVSNLNVIRELLNMKSRIAECMT
jgi:hypothetical protein